LPDAIVYWEEIPGYLPGIILFGLPNPHVYWKQIAKFIFFQLKKSLLFVARQNLQLR